MLLSRKDSGRAASGTGRARFRGFTLVELPAVSRCQRTAFTLVELLVVIAIIGVLVALLLPAIQAAREAARRMQCANNLKQIGLGLLNYESANKTFPPGELVYNSPCTGNAGAKPCKFYSWSTTFLPFIEEQSNHDRMDFKKDLKIAPNWQADLSGPTNQVIAPYVCPSIGTRQKQRGEDNRLKDFNGNGYSSGTGEGLGCIDYIGSPGPGKNIVNITTNAAYGDNRGVLLRHTDTVQTYAPVVRIKKITDGTSKTIIVAECSGRGVGLKSDGSDDVTKLDGSWSANDNTSPVKLNINIRPVELSWTDQEIWSDHTSGANVLMCDGSVHFVNEEIDVQTVLAPLCSRDGGESVDTAAFSK